MIGIAIVDDVPNMVLKIADIILETKYSKEMYVEYFAELNEFIYYFVRNRKMIKIVCLDINFGKEKDGITIAKRLKCINPKIIVIFVSGHTEYFPRIVNAEPFRFVNKLHIEDMKEAITAAIERVHYESERKYFAYKVGHEERKVPLEDIIYLKSERRRILITFVDGRTESFYGKMDEALNSIRKESLNFIKINRSYIINNAYVTEYVDDYVIMVNDEKIIWTDLYKYANEKQ